MSDEKLAIGTLEGILAAETTAAQGVTMDVPEWNCAVRLRGLTRGEVRAMAAQEDGQKEPFALAACLIEPAITQEQAFELCNANSFAATQRVFDRILEVSGLAAGFRSGEAA